MPTESGYKKPVASGALEFRIGSDRFLRVQIPVASTKTESAVPLIEEVVTAVINRYNSDTLLNPRDLANILRSVAAAVESNQRTITEAKYNDKKTRPNN